jgi:hypothetical protein
MAVETGPGAPTRPGVPAASGAPTPPAIAPGPDAAPFRWSRDVSQLFTRETLVPLAGIYALIAVILVGTGIVGAIAMPSQAAMIILVMLGVIVAVPGMMWAAVAFGNLEYGRPKPTAWELGPAGLRVANELEDPAIPGAVITAFGVLDALTDDPSRTHHGRVRPPHHPIERSSVDEVPWETVSGATYEDRRHVVLVRRLPRGRIPCYCGPDEWPTVCSWVRWGVDEGARRRAAAARPAPAEDS